MNHQPRGFIDHQHRIIFIYNVEGNILGYDFAFVARAVHHHRNHVVGFYPIVRLYGLAVGEDTTRLGSLLDAVAGCPLHVVDQKFVDAQKLLPLVGHEAEMFVHLPSGGRVASEVLEFRLVELRLIEIRLRKRSVE